MIRKRRDKDDILFEIKEEERSARLASLLHTISPCTVRYGEWPQCSIQHKIVYLPIHKNMSNEYFSKLMVWAVHEAAHLRYSDPVNEKTFINNYHGEVWNYIEDIRIEYLLTRDFKQLLKPLITFIDLRRLLVEQLGYLSASVPCKILLWLQFYLMGAEDLISFPEVETTYKEVKKKASDYCMSMFSMKFNRNSLIHLSCKDVVEISKVIGSLLWEDFNKKDEKIDIQVDGFLKELVEASGIENKALIEGINERYPHNLTYEKSPKNQLISSDLRRVLEKKFHKAAYNLKNIFLAGWRAERNVISSNLETGDLDEENIYKIFTKGKERDFFEEERRKMRDGLFVLSLLDISGSMDSYFSEVLGSTVVLDSATPIQSNIYSRIVLFSTSLVLVKDYHVRKASIPDETFIRRISSGTNLAGALNTEYFPLVKQKGDKYLVIVTDGSPSDVGTCADYLDKYLSKEVQILILFFGEKSNSLFKTLEARNILKKLVYLHFSPSQLEKLPQLLAGNLKKIIFSSMKRQSEY